MSTKIINKLKNPPEKIVLDKAEFSYINALDAVGRSFDHYIRGLKTEFLQIIALRNGWKPQDDQLELTIDLRDESRELLVKKATIDNKK